MQCHACKCGRCVNWCWTQKRTSSDTAPWPVHGASRSAKKLCMSTWAAPSSFMARSHFPFRSLATLANPVFVCMWQMCWWWAEAPSICCNDKANYLCFSANTTIVAAERNDLLLFDDVLQESGGLANVHVLDGLSCLAGVLQSKTSKDAVTTAPCCDREQTDKN